MVVGDSPEDRALNGNALCSRRERESVVRDWLEKVGVAGLNHAGDEPGAAGLYRILR